VEDNAYMNAVRDRMSKDGYDSPIGVPPFGAWLLGHRGDFRWSWFATQMHLFVAVKQVHIASRADVEQFTSKTLAAGRKAYGRFRGLGIGVGAIPVLVAAHVEDDALRFAETVLVRQFGAGFAWPVTVDLTTGHRGVHLDDPKVGYIYTSWMRQQIDSLFPIPGSNY
jgi:hypothetical protein